MLSLKKLSIPTVLLLFLSACLFSCTKDNDTEIDDNQEAVTSQDFTAGINQARNTEDKERCFEFVYPVSVTMPDNSTITAENEDGLTAIKDWYEANPESRERFTINYPVDIIKDEVTQTINNDEEWRSIKEDCGGGKGNHHDKDYNKHEERGACFEFVYPITVILPNDSTITVENEDGFSAVKDWYTANPEMRERFTLQFPVSITTEDGTTSVINSQEELKAAKKECGCDEGHGYKGNKESCFEVVFPITVIMPDNSTITVESEDDFSKVKDWYEANPETREKFTLQFPISITKEDDSTVIINSEDELKALKEECHDDGDDDDDDEN